MFPTKVWTGFDPENDQFLVRPRLEFNQWFTSLTVKTTKLVKFPVKNAASRKFSECLSRLTDGKNCTEDFLAKYFFKTLFIYQKVKLTKKVYIFENFSIWSVSSVLLNILSMKVSRPSQKISHFDFTCRVWYRKFREAFGSNFQKKIWKFEARMKNEWFLRKPLASW